MQELQHSAETDKLAEALAKAQGLITNPKPSRTVTVTHKNSKGSHSYSYVELSALYDAIRKPLSDNGIAWTHLTILTPDIFYLSTRLIHSSGQWIESRFPLPRVGAAQDIGAAMTYARRYTLSALTGVSSETDSDGDNAAPVQSAEQLRDQLIEFMSEASFGNAAVLNYLQTAHNIGQGLTSVEQLDDGSVAELVQNWTTYKPAIAALKSAPKPDAKILPLPAATTAPTTQEPMLTADKPAETTAFHPDLAPTLAAAMKEAGITEAALKAYVVSQKHQPQTLEPHQYRADYVALMLQPKNWTAIVAGARALSPTTTK